MSDVCVLTHTTKPMDHGNGIRSHPGPLPCFLSIRIPPRSPLTDSPGRGRGGQTTHLITHATCVSEASPLANRTELPSLQRRGPHVAPSLATPVRQGLLSESKKNRCHPDLWQISGHRHAPRSNSKASPGASPCRSSAAVPSVPAMPIHRAGTWRSMPLSTLPAALPRQRPGNVHIVYLARCHG